MQRAALAEQLPHSHIEETGPALHAVPDEPERLPVYAAHEVDFEDEAQVRFNAWLGEVATRDAEMSEDQETADDINILERIKAARDGDREAEAWLSINASTAIFEAVFKKDYASDIYMDKNPDGSLAQFGQTNDSIHHNAITHRPGRHETLKDITQAENLNWHRIEAAFESGKLKDYYYVVWSLVPDGVPEEQLGAKGDGYFLDSMSLSIQATTETADGRAKTEVAFMAGVEEQEGDAFEERLVRRHDFQAVAKIYEWLQQQAPDKAADLLRGGLYIPKEMMPNGVTDAMYWTDCAADEVLGREIERHPEDYAAIKLESKRKEASLEDVREKVIQGLKDAAGVLENAGQASRYMWQLIKEHATQASLTNLNIDPKAFGRKAADSIEQARSHLSNGNERMAQDHMNRAQKEAEVTGCGGGAAESAEEDSANAENSGDLSYVAGRDSKGSRAFRCSNGHLNIRPRERTIPECQHDGCKAAVAC